SPKAFFSLAVDYQFNLLVRHVVLDQRGYFTRAREAVLYRHAGLAHIVELRGVAEADAVVSQRRVDNRQRVDRRVDYHEAVAAVVQDTDVVEHKLLLQWVCRSRVERARPDVHVEMHRKASA